MRVAVLDDYQGVALEMADWSTLPRGTQVQVFRDHLVGTDAVAERLKDFEIVAILLTWPSGQGAQPECARKDAWLPSIEKNE